mgnify:CR=1 FL=1
MLSSMVSEGTPDYLNAKKILPDIQWELSLHVLVCNEHIREIECMNTVVMQGGRSSINIRSVALQASTWKYFVRLLAIASYCEKKR